MAEAAVNFAIETLGPLLVEEIRLWGGVRKEVQSINSELESLRSVLKDADARAAVEELEGGDYLPEGVGNLFNLHYLSLRNTKVEKIPKSVGNLLSLEILDLKNSLVRELPVEIRNLKKLRYLMVYQYHYTAGFSIAGEAVAKVHRGLGSLTDLQKLSIIEADSQVLKELMKLRQLRKLGIRPQNGNGKDVCALIANLENLESLIVLMASKEEILDLQSLSSPPQYLQRLYLKGNMKKLPDWIFKLKNLIRLGLVLSGLTQDPIRVLQALPNLLELLLTGVYNYELFHFEAGWFP
ncbi:disease resistance protein RPM1-like [Citrus sinensis]|uniref:disease resistance protein RPM1-like n=1 Tax=Citrus sinensis TaxID=2711 RepID=UPI0022780BE6|nr:disease resistance protein RPM1-like [Citrus sinensis]